MSDSSRPYKSHLFNFLNRHSLRLRDRLGETFRHLKIAAEWGAQVLTLPFNWLFQANQWDGPVLQPGRKQAILPPVEYLSNPPVDQPLVRVMTVIEPWFELPELATESPLLASQNDLVKVNSSVNQSLLKIPSTVPQIVLTSAFFEQVRQRLIPENLNLIEDKSSIAQSPALPPSPLGQLVQNFKNSLNVTKPQDVIIQGLACLLENRQLVLTTTENDILEVLSPKQQQTLQQAIASELAAFSYEKRLQWALSQKRLGFIPLVNSQAKELSEDSLTETNINNLANNLSDNLTNDLTVIAPVKWFYQKLRWAEQLIYNFQCNANSSVMILRSNSLPNPPLLRQLDYTVARLEEKEIAWGQRVQHQLNQGFNTLRQTPLLEASIETTSNIIQQVNLADKLQLLKTEIQEKLPFNGLIPRTANSLDSSHSLEATEPDPFQIQLLIQAAIAYFFGPAAGTPLVVEGVEKNNRLAPEENWLDWDDLFTQGDRPHPIQTFAPPILAPELRPGSITSQALTKPRKPKSKAISPSSRSSNLPVPQSPNLPVPQSPSPLISQQDYLPDSAIKSDDLAVTNQKQTVTAKSFSLSKPWEVELEAAFDWIETEGKAIGYHKHLLEWILEILDQLVLWLEESLKKVWHWLHQQYLAKVR